MDRGRGALNVEASEERFCERNAHLRDTAKVDLEEGRGRRARWDGGRWIRGVRGRGKTRGITGQQCADADMSAEKKDGEMEQSTAPHILFNAPICKWSAESFSTPRRSRSCSLETAKSEHEKVGGEEKGVRW